MRHTAPIRLRARLAGLLVAAVSLTLAMPAMAQWKWRDASGRVTASDLPPPRDIPEKDVLQRPSTAQRAPAPAPAAASAAPAVASTAAQPVDKDLEARKRAADAQQKAKQKAEEQRIASLRAENCGRARNHLATLESGQRMARINAKGEREVIDDATRADETRRAREVIASDCR
ncbi:MAG: hypothetical protein RJA10_4302 [Pseudomonadota bacterium]|jgi:hypothetical protein